MLPENSTRPLIIQRQAILSRNTTEGNENGRNVLNLFRFASENRNFEFQSIWNIITKKRTIRYLTLVYIPINPFLLIALSKLPRRRQAKHQHFQTFVVYLKPRPRLESSFVKHAVRNKRDPLPGWN